MNKCDECGAPQYEGALFCSECGKTLEESASRPTNVLPFSKTGRRAAPQAPIRYTVTPASPPVSLTFVIAGSRRTINTNLKHQIVIGRADVDAEVAPELDLTEFEGLEKGVSRSHAVLQMTDKGIILLDLDSTNGTMINGNRLTPERAYVIKSGDELRFGDLLLHVFFTQ